MKGLLRLLIINRLLTIHTKRTIESRGSIQVTNLVQDPLPLVVDIRAFPSQTLNHQESLLLGSVTMVLQEDHI